MPTQLPSSLRGGITLPVSQIYGVPFLAYLKRDLHSRYLEPSSASDLTALAEGESGSTIFLARDFRNHNFATWRPARWLTDLVSPPMISSANWSPSSCHESTCLIESWFVLGISHHSYRVGNGLHGLSIWHPLPTLSMSSTTILLSRMFNNPSLCPVAS